MGISRISTRSIVALAAAAIVGFLGAITIKLWTTPQPPTAPQRRVRAAIPTGPARARQVLLYYVAPDGRHLRAEEREVVAAGDLSFLEAILTALISGPRDHGLASPIPPGTKVSHVFLSEAGTAYVDFSEELSNHHPGGVAAERLTVAAIVNSLVLNIDQVRRVVILAGGKPLSTLAGHLDLGRPRRADLLIIR